MVYHQQVLIIEEEEIDYDDEKRDVLFVQSIEIIYV
jgi:hypothetical protein